MLGLMLILGMGLSAVQANSMMIGMALAGDMGVSGSGECTGCGGDDAAKSGSCLSICASSVLAVAAPITTASKIGPAVSVISIAFALHSMAVSPDPYPPRLTFLL